MACTDIGGHFFVIIQCEFSKLVSASGQLLLLQMFWRPLVAAGFGSFVEKTVMPFISTSPAMLQNPCSLHQHCTSPFSYKNVLSLTSNGTEFNRLVGEQQISGNLDSPEGGFDAMMQVAVCGVSALCIICGCPRQMPDRKISKKKKKDTSKCLNESVLTGFVLSV